MPLDAAGRKLGRHLVPAGQVPHGADHALEARRVADRFRDQVQRKFLLHRRGGGFAVQRGGVPGEVGYQNFEQLIQDVVVGFVDRGLFEDQLRVGQQGEQLTDREQEILTLLSKGYQYKEIADAAGVKLETVRSHIKHIYDKLHVRSRTEATLKFLGEVAR